MKNIQVGPGRCYSTVIQRGRHKGHTPETKSFIVDWLDEMSYNILYIRNVVNKDMQRR